MLCEGGSFSEEQAAQAGALASDGFYVLALCRRPLSPSLDVDAAEWVTSLRRDAVEMEGTAVFKGLLLFRN